MGDQNNINFMMNMQGLNGMNGINGNIMNNQNNMNFNMMGNNPNLINTMMMGNNQNMMGNNPNLINTMMIGNNQNMMGNNPNLINTMMMGNNPNMMGNNPNLINTMMMGNNHNMMMNNMGNMDNMGNMCNMGNMGNMNNMGNTMNFIPFQQNIPNMGMMDNTMNNQIFMNNYLQMMMNNNNNNNNNQEQNIPNIINNDIMNIIPKNNPQEEVKDLSKLIEEKEKENKKKLIFDIINKDKVSGKNYKHAKEMEVLSDMAVMGTITKEYIIADTANDPNKYLTTQNALLSNEYYYFVLGILSDYLSKQGVLTAIEKKDQNKLKEQKLKEIDTFLQFLINGLINIKKHDLRFEFGWDKNQSLLLNIDKQEEFMDSLRVTLSQGLKINKDQMVITYPRSGSVLVTVIFNSEDFNNITVNQLQKIFADHYPDLNHLIGIESNIILDGILLNPELLDEKGNNLNQGWGKNEQRGGRPYYPPLGWKGYGLKVLGKYDNGNNVWLNYNGVKGEWCVAYHGASQKINHNYSKMRDEEDSNHPGQKVGEGVYVSPKPNVLDNEGGIVTIGNKKYKIGFMLRVNPTKLRIAKSNPDYWVLNGNSSEIRPYRILIKEI